MDVPEIVETSDSEELEALRALSSNYWRNSHIDHFEEGDQSLTHGCDHLDVVARATREDGEGPPAKRMRLSLAEGSVHNHNIHRHATTPGDTQLRPQLSPSTNHNADITLDSQFSSPIPSPLTPSGSRGLSSELGDYLLQAPDKHPAMSYEEDSVGEQGYLWRGRSISATDIGPSQKSFSVAGRSTPGPTRVVESLAPDFLSVESPYLPQSQEMSENSAVLQDDIGWSQPLDEPSQGSGASPIVSPSSPSKQTRPISPMAVPPTPVSSRGADRTQVRSPSLDPLCLFTPPARRANASYDASIPSQPQTPHNVGHPQSAPSSPLSPHSSPSKPIAELGPAHAARAGSAPPSQRQPDNEDVELIAALQAEEAAQAHNRYSLRARQARQLNPYAYDKLLYKRQMRANPDAIVKVVSPRRERRRRSRGEGSGSEEESQYVDAGVDEERDEGWRQRRRKEKSRSVSVPGGKDGGPLGEGHRRSDGLEHQVAMGRDGRMAAAADRAPSPPSVRQRWYPDAFQEGLSSSSSSEDIDLGLLAKPRKKKDRADVRHRRRKAKPFPISEHPRSPSRDSPRRSPPKSQHITETIELESDEDVPAPRSTLRRHKSGSIPVFRSPVNSSSPVRELSPPPDHFDNFDHPINCFGDEFESSAPAPPTSTDVEVSVHSDFDPVEILAEGPLRLRRKSDSSEEQSDSGSDSSSVELSARDRRRMKVLRRMMPGVLVSKHLKQPKPALRRHASQSSSSHSDDNPSEHGDGPLLPGQSRVRRSGNPRTSVEIRGDQESSDVDMVDAGVMSMSAFTASSSESEMDVVRVSSKPHKSNPSASRPSHQEVIEIEDDQSVDEEIGEWLSGKPSHSRRRVDRGEVREGDLIDRMLTRTRVSGGRKTGRRQGKHGTRHRKHHRSSAGKVHVMTAGARKTGAARQTLLPFTRNDQKVAPEKSSSPVTGEHRVDVDKATRDMEETRRKLKKQKRRGNLYTFTSGPGYLTSGRSHRDPINIDAEELDVEDRRVPFAKGRLAKRHVAALPHYQRPLTQAEHVETTLEHYWNLAATADEDRLSEHIHTRVSRDPDRALWRQITVDMDIPLLPSGISFDAHGYVVRGCLRELVSVISADADLPPPTVCSIFEVHLLPEMRPHDISLALEKACDSARDLLAQSRVRTQEECRQWQVLFHALSQHITWAVKMSNEEEQLHVHSTAATQMARLCAFLDQPLDVIPEEDGPNLLELEVRWFLFELTCRLRCSAPNRVERLDGFDSLQVVKSLLRTLWLYGFAHVMAPFADEDFSGPIELSTPERAAEIWVSLIHVFAAWSDRMSLNVEHADGKISFWGLISTVIQSAGVAEQHASDLSATETLWRGLFSLSALSQFSVHGLTTSVIRLPACWRVVDFALQKTPLVATAGDTHLKRRALVKRDQYVRVLVSRCVLLRQKWGWALDEPSLVFNRLLQIFKTRHYANLCDEPSDFPSWLRHNDLRELAKIKRSDTAWSLFLKWLVHVHAPKEEGSSEPSAMPLRLRKLLSIAMPMGAVPFTKAKPPADHELSMLYNRFTAVALAIYAEPTLANVKNRLASARRYVNFKDTDNETRRACIRGLMQLTILLRHLHLPLSDILDWLTDLTNILIDEYREVDTSSAKAPAVGPRRWLVMCIQMILGCVRRVIETPMMDPETTMAQYPDPALLQGPWITRIFAAETNLTSVPSTSVEVRRLVQAFLDARSSVVPNPSRVRPRAVAEESQESQDDYGMFDLDMDDPELLAALGQPEQSSRAQDIKEKEEIICEIMDKTISQAIYRLVYRHVVNSSQDGTNPGHLQDADRWVDCWVGCAWVVVQNGRRNWSHFFLMGAQSWDFIIDPWYRYRVGMRFMYALLQRDANAYSAYTERFVDLLMECLATGTVTFEHEYASLLFSIDGLRHPLFRDLPVELPENSFEYKFSKKEFLDKRLSIVQHILVNLANNLLKESAGDFSLTADNQHSITSLLNMLPMMQRTRQRFTSESEDQASYLVFCKEVANLISMHASLHTNTRLASLFNWITSIP